MQREPPDGGTNSEGWVCPRPWLAIYANGDSGEVSVCSWTKHAVGDLSKQSAEEIWNGPGIQELRKDLAAGNYEKHCRPHCPVLARKYDVATGYLLPDRKNLTELQRANRDLALVQLGRRELKVTHKPLHAKVFVTNRCGMECAHCDIWRDEVKRERDFATEFAFAMPALLQIEGKGGEPMMSRNWLHFIKHVQETHPGLLLKMVTNGKFSSENILERHFPPPEAWDWIGVSMDAARPSTLAIIRNGLDLQILRDGIVRLAEYSKDRFVIGIHVTVMRDNIFELEEIVDWFERELNRFPLLQLIFAIVDRRDENEQQFGQGDLKEEHFEAVLRFCRRHRKNPRILGLPVLAELIRARQHPSKKRLLGRLGAWLNRSLHSS